MKSGHVHAISAAGNIAICLVRLYLYLYSVHVCLYDIDTKLFLKMRNGYHCINSLLPSNKSSVII